eukprot:Rmarinus@m.9506
MSDICVWCERNSPCRFVQPPTPKDTSGEHETVPGSETCHDTDPGMCNILGTADAITVREFELGFPGLMTEDEVHKLLNCSEPDSRLYIKCESDEFEALLVSYDVSSRIATIRRFPEAKDVVPLSDVAHVNTSQIQFVCRFPVLGVSCMICDGEPMANKIHHFVRKLCSQPLQFEIMRGEESIMDERLEALVKKCVKGPVRVGSGTSEVQVGLDTIERLQTLQAEKRVVLWNSMLPVRTYGIFVGPALVVLCRVSGSTFQEWLSAPDKGLMSGLNTLMLLLGIEAKMRNPVSDGMMAEINADPESMSWKLFRDALLDVKDTYVSRRNELQTLQEEVEKARKTVISLQQDLAGMQ